MGFDGYGFCVIENVIDQEEIDRLIRFTEEQLAKDDRRGGVRNLLNFPEMRALAQSRGVRQIVDELLGPEAKPVRGILFDKTGDANWKVAWHQDVTIAVADRVDAEGYGPWSRKAGVTHVQPPAPVLEQMISIRIHLDECPEANGALKVIPGSHAMGKIPEADIAQMVEQGPVTVCEVGVGGVLAMRPLLVHSSSAAIVPGHRRVIHFDYAVAALAQGLRWAMDIGHNASTVSP
jgi:ectoine hydroxylase-related dioxygenase (phytanoyl-CoA dioxygenase family)